MCILKEAQPSPHYTVGLTEHENVYVIYRIASFYHEDFNIAFGSIRNIKIHVIFVKRNILWQMSHSNASIILQAIVY